MKKHTHWPGTHHSDSKQQRVQAQIDARQPHPKVEPRLQKGLSRRDRAMGFGTYLHVGRADA